MKKVEEVQRSYQPVATLIEESHGNRKDTAGQYVKKAAGEMQSEIPRHLSRAEISHFPELSEFEVVRHFTQLSQLNFSIDGGFYPLGSCTMKYNPKVNDVVAGMSGFSQLHPYAPQEHTQGSLEVMHLLQKALLSITGLSACSLHPAAGAHGELVGVKMMAAYHRKKGDTKRNTILVPDSAHGTNPASAALCGVKVKQIPTGPRGMLEIEHVKAAIDETTIGIMMTVPNTLGIFEEHIVEISELIHAAGGLVYMDGANLNALVGQVDLGKIGIDVMHINLHKTFSTPHGGGGPGAGPVCVSDRLKDFLPVPVVSQKPDGTYYLDETIPHTVGKYRAFYGNFGMLVRALCYIYAFGKDYLPDISEVAVLNANYMRAKLKDTFHLPFSTPSMHEVVFSDKIQKKETGVKTLDMAKRLLDFGFHPPTMYFPLVVDGAIMIEPTETEPKDSMDQFIATMKHIAQECKDHPETVKNAPYKVGLKRVDETRAARNPVLTWNQED